MLITTNNDNGEFSYTIQYDNNGGYWTSTFSTTNGSFQYYPYHIKNCMDILTSRVISRKFVPATEERMEEYIMNNYDRYDIQEYGSYIYQMIQEKAYDFASEVVNEAEDEYIISDEDAVIETIMEEIDFDSLYDLVEDILNAPITMEEKLADIGMSMRDFL